MQTRLQKKSHALRTIKRIVNRIDPISKCVVRYPFYLYRSNTFIVYDVVTLHRYIENTGDFLDPICRQPYVKHELMRLDRMTKKSFKLIDNKENLICKRNEEINRVKLVEYFSNEACNILEVFLIEHNNFPIELEEILTPSLLQISENMSSISLYHEIQVLLH